MCGYIFHKEGLVPSENVTSDYIKSSEFTRLGQLSHPSEDLYDLSQYLFAYYKSVPVKTCANRLITAFQEISDVAFFAFDKSVFRQFVNTFSKGFAVQSPDKKEREKGSEKDRCMWKKGKVKVLLMMQPNSVPFEVEK